MSTPPYVKEAVLAYMEKKAGDSLAQMFENGIPLHLYPESRDIISKLLKGKAVRKKGRPQLSRDDKAKQYGILLLVAELHGAGLGVFSGSDNASKETACDIVGKIHGMSAKNIFDNIWTPNQELEAVKNQIEIGKCNKQVLILFGVD